jgi:hypothetical protein
MGTIADGNVIEADDVLSSMRTTAEAGESITIGKACYIKESDGKAYLSDKTSAPYFTGIAYAGVDSGADVTLVTKGKFVTTGLVDKEVYYLGSSGAISTTASDIRIGSADGTTDLYIDKELAITNQVKFSVTNDIAEATTTNTSFEDMAGWSTALTTTQTCTLVLEMIVPLDHNGDNRGEVNLNLDIDGGGYAVKNLYAGYPFGTVGTDQGSPVYMKTVLTGQAAGVYTIKGQWKTTANTLIAVGNDSEYPSTCSLIMITAYPEVAQNG